MCGDDQAGLQIAWSLLQRQVPSRILHLLRSHPTAVTDNICEQTQTELQENLRYWLQYPVLNADQWKLAELPITSGGLALPNLRRQAVVARIACLATLPEFVATDPYKADIIEKERPALFGRLGPTPWKFWGTCITRLCAKVSLACLKIKSSRTFTTLSVAMSYGQSETNSPHR